MIRIICKNQFNEVEWVEKTRSWKKAWQIVRDCGATPEEVAKFGDILVIQPNRKGTSRKNDNPLHLLSRRNVLPIAMKRKYTKAEEDQLIENSIQKAVKAASKVRYIPLSNEQIKKMREQDEIVNGPEPSEGERKIAWEKYHMIY